MHSYTLCVSHPSHSNSTRVDLSCEATTAQGWSYIAEITHPDGTCFPATVRLSCADYEFWCGGIEPPAAVAERGIRIALESLETLPQSFDVAAFRRRIEGFDDRMRRA